MLGRLSLLTLLLLLAPHARGQQPELHVEVVRAAAGATMQSNTTRGATVPARVTAGVSSSGVLAAGRTPELLQNGFPAKLRYRLELWRKGNLLMGDEREGHTSWDVFVSFDPATQTYRAVRQHGGDLEDFGGFATLAAVEAQLTRTYPVALTPRNRGARYYYHLLLEVETLSLTDLGELQRWLRGDVQPAVRGDANPATALSRGIGTLISRVLGGDRRRYAHRTGTFRP